jgi:hypothetical protein
MDRIYEGPTSVTSKPGPAPLPQGQQSGLIRRATSDLGGHLSYLDKRLCLAPPKAPSTTIHWPPPRGWAATWRELSRAAQEVQEQRGTRICPVKRLGNDEIFPNVGSGLLRRPITWMLNSGQGHVNPSPARHRTTRPDPTSIREKVEACTRSPNLMGLACSWVWRSHLRIGAAAMPPYEGYHD